MSNRFHNKFHRHNHHTEPTDRSGRYPDSAYDPIASPEAPFRGEFYVDGNITTLSSVSASGDLYASNGTFHEDVAIEGNLSVLGTTTQLDTFVYVTSAVDITNAGPGPALKVTQTGSQDIATFYDNFATALIIKEGGNVGIGTNAPEAKLTVSGTLSTSSTVEFPNIGLGEDNSVVILNSSGFLKTDEINPAVWDTTAKFISASDIDLTTGYIPKAGNLFGVQDSVIFDNGTNIGIGTNNPEAKLTVSGTLSTSGTATIGTIATGTGTSFVVENNGLLQKRALNIAATDTTNRFVSAFDADLSVNYLTKAKNSNGIDESIIYDDGTNIGIGEPSPEGKLHVKSGSAGSVIAQPNSTGIFESSSNAYVSILSPNAQYAGVVMGGPGNPYGAYMSWNHDNNALKVATAHSGGAIQLLVNTEQEAVRILSGGNVGIGTINPKEKLTISGNLSSSGTATIGTIATDNTNNSFVVETNGLLQKRTLNVAAGNTTATFVSASDGALSVNYLTKATDSNGINESIISDNGNLVYVGGNVTISGNLTALGNSYFANTLFTTTSSISVVNYGPGPAIYAYQSSGNQDIASFYDGDGVEVLHVGNCPPGGLYGKVGINESNPNKELTVKGSVSASGTLNLGTINTNATSDSIVVLGTNNILEKRTVDSRTWGTSLVDGTGTTNYVTKWSVSNTVTDSIIFDNGTTVTAKGALSSTGNFTSNGTATIGTIADNLTNTSIVVQAAGLLQKRTLNAAAFDTTSRFVSASDTNLNVNYLTKATNSNGIDESIVYDDGTTVTAKGALSSTGNFTSNGTATIGTIATGTADTVLIESSGLVQKRTIDSRAWGSSLVDGTGTANRVAYWTDSNTIAADSDFFFDGTNVGIGTTSPGVGVKLDVAGTIAADYLRLDATDGVAEGGEIQLKGAGTYGDLQIDNHSGNLRLHTLGVNNHFQILGGGSTTALRVENGGAYIGSIATGTTNSVIIESSGTLQKRTIDSTAWNPGATYQPIITGAATTIVSSNLATSMALVSDASGKVAASSTVTSTELGYLDGVTSNIQTQLGGKQANLGFTPVQQGGGTDQSSNKLYIGWSSASKLKLQIDSTNFGADWPINITGMLKPETLQVTPQSTTTLPQSNDVEFAGHGAEVTIASFSGCVRGVTYTLTNKGSYNVIISSTASVFVRGGNTWASNACASYSGKIILPPNHSCSLRADSATNVSVW